MKFAVNDRRPCTVSVKVSTIFGRPFVKRFALCYRTVVCPVCLSVMCGQTAGWIKMPLGTDVGIGPGDIVLDGDPAPDFRPMSVVAKRLDASRCHLVRR